MGNSWLNVDLDSLLVGPIPIACGQKELLPLLLSSASGAERLKHLLLVSLHGRGGVTNEHNQFLEDDLCQGIPEVQQRGGSPECQGEVDDPRDVGV